MDTGTATLVDVVRLVVGALGGAAIGLERQWSGHATGEDARMAGIRTFTLLGGLGALAGLLSFMAPLSLALVLLVGALALVVLGYHAASHRQVDGTTEVAAIVVLGTGLLAGRGELALSSGIVAVTTLLLNEKTRLHDWVARIDDRSLRAGVRFAVMATVILPLLPMGPVDPFGWIRPRPIWILVLFFSGLSFAGYIARKLVGPQQGYAVAGLLGGFVSSTSVSLTYGRLSRGDAAAPGGLASGLVAASSIMFVRVLVAVAVLDASILPRLALLVAPPLAVGAAATVWMMRRRGDHVPPADDEVSNPLRLGAALQMALLFQVVFIAMPYVERAMGDRGLIAGAAVLGLTSVDAPTVSIARGTAGDVAAATAAVAIAAGALSNTLMKVAIVLAIGQGRFRRIAVAGLLAIAVAGGGAVLLLA